MARDIHTQTAEAAQKQQVICCHLGKFEFKDETLYFNTSPVDLTFDSQTWYAVGNLGRIEDITETDEMRSNGINVHMNLINEKMRVYASNLDYANRPATIYRAYLTDSFSIIGSPLVLFYGSMDNVTFNEQGKDSSMTLSITDHLVDWARNRNGRYTNEDQKLVDSTDTGLSHLQTAVQKSRGEIEVEWSLT